MQWKIWCEDKTGIVCIHNKGYLTNDDFKKQVIEASACMSEHGSKLVLVDYRVLSSEINIFNIYDLPIFYKEIQFPIGARVAFLTSDELSVTQKEHFEFFETVCVNTGYNVKLFKDEDAARKWLSET